MNKNICVEKTILLIISYITFSFYISFSCSTLPKMQEAGFEPAPSKRIVPETIALDRSATLAYIDNSNLYYRNWCDTNIQWQTNNQNEDISVKLICSISF